MSHIASAVLMRTLFAARTGRFNILRLIAALGSRITTWKKLCDVRLRCFIYYTKGVAD